MKKAIVCMLMLAMLVSAAAFAEYEYGQKLKVVKCNEYITLRKSPGTKAAELDRIPLGAQVKCVGEAENGFICVEYGGWTGYALEKYLAPAGKNTAVSSDRGDVGRVMTVYGCEEYITLREEPATSADALARIPLGAEVVMLGRGSNGFAQVSYEGQTGYALEKYLVAYDEHTGKPVSVSSDEYYNINLFLSNFSEQDFMTYEGYFDVYESPDWALVDFAINFVYFNRYHQLEEGDYFNYNNTRMSVKYVDDVTQKYFGRTPVDYTPLYHDYSGGYYYWTETGGHIPAGFVIHDKVFDLGDGRYGVEFKTYGAYMGWENSDCRLSAAKAAGKYPEDDAWRGKGYAVIDVGNGNLSDRSTWRLERWVFSRNF